MYNGVWISKEKTPRNVLILGESHYDKPDKQGTISSITTSSVMEYYMCGGGVGTKFFSNIAASFGYTKAEYSYFYNRVYFGNYVDELCGVAEWNHAQEFINENKTRYNDELFRFCNENGIDIIVCFSMRCYNAMPKREEYEKPQEEIFIGEISRRKNCIKKFIYHPGKRNDCNTFLNNDLIVYGVKHPSSQSGYSIKQVYDFMVGDEDISWLCKK